MAMRWLEKKVDFLGALDPASNAQAKALLASFNTTDGQNCVNGYGLEPDDVDPTTWKTRDGNALACFANWWKANNKQPAVFPAPGSYTWIDLKPEHLQALLQWGVEKGVINPGQSPAPPLNCALACQQKYAGDLPSLGACLAACGPRTQPQPSYSATYAACQSACLSAHATDPTALVACVKQCGPSPEAELPVPIPPLPSPPAPIQSVPSSSEGIGAVGVLAIVGAVLGLAALLLR